MSEFWSGDKLFVLVGGVVMILAVIIGPLALIGKLGQKWPEATERVLSILFFPLGLIMYLALGVFMLGMLALMVAIPVVIVLALIGVL